MYYVTESIVGNVMSGYRRLSSRISIIFLKWMSDQKKHILVIAQQKKSVKPLIV